MLVEIVELRCEGKKLAPEEVRRAEPRIAELRVERDASGLLCAYLAYPWYGPAGHGQRAPSLRDVRLLRLRGADFLLAGTEQVGFDWQHRNEPQAWWCRLPAGGEAARPAPVAPPPPIPIPIPERWREKA